MIISEGQKIQEYEGNAQVPYTQIDILGTGCCGTVGKVQDKRTGELFARKTLVFNRLTQTAQERRLRNEIQVTCKLSTHHHFIKFAAAYKTKRYYGLILKPVADKGDLAEYLEGYWKRARTRGVAADDAELRSMQSLLERAFGCLANGLAFMKTQCVRHKDIKSKNILVHQDSVMFTDFGGSFDSSADSNSASTGPSMFLTRKYSAPEVLKDQLRDSKSDVWSLGCVFLEMLSALTLSFNSEIDEKGLFAEKMVRVHAAVSAAGIPPKYTFLPEVIIVMTAEQASKRPSASDVTEHLLQHAGFSCSRCQGTNIYDPPAALPAINEGIMESAGEVTKAKTWPPAAPPPPLVAASSTVSDLVTPWSISAEPAGLYASIVDPDQPKNPESENTFAMGADRPLDARVLTVPHESSQVQTYGPASSSTNHTSWTWSHAHQDYYCVIFDQNGQPVYFWATEMSAAPADRAAHQYQTNSRGWSGTTGSSTAADTIDVLDSTPAPSVPWEIRQTEPNFIAGDPKRGWYDELDPSYRMRTRVEARGFFVLGRVFSMLYTEPDSTHPARDDEAFTYVRFRAVAYAQIRRFVVVSVRKNFVRACAILTYRNQGTLKPGCDPGEHALIYNRGVDPETCYIAGEREGGLYKEPIEVEAADGSAQLARGSRLRFGKVYAIEWNVKVKDLGRVSAHHLTLLIAHYEEEEAKGLSFE